MQYFVGSLVTIVTMLLMTRLFIKNDASASTQIIQYSQSRAFEILKPIYPTNSEIKKYMPLKTQSKAFQDKISVRILFIDDKAYWIRDNALYNAEMENGTVMQDTAQVVDTMDMDKKQLDKVMFIVEKLTEGLTNDSGNSGK